MRAVVDGAPRARPAKHVVEYWHAKSMGLDLRSYYYQVPRTGGGLLGAAAQRRARCRAEHGCRLVGAGRPARPRARTTGRERPARRRLHRPARARGARGRQGRGPDASATHRGPCLPARAPAPPRPRRPGALAAGEPPHRWLARVRRRGWRDRGHRDGLRRRGRPGRALLDPDGAPRPRAGSRARRRARAPGPPALRAADAHRGHRRGRQQRQCEPGGGRFRGDPVHLRPGRAGAPGGRGAALAGRGDLGRRGQELHLPLHAAGPPVVGERPRPRARRAWIPRRAPVLGRARTGALGASGARRRRGRVAGGPPAAPDAADRSRAAHDRAAGGVPGPWPFARRARRPRTRDATT